MNVGFFIPGLHSGGAERVIITLANQISLLGHDVDLILATNVKNESYINEIADSINIIRLEAKTTFKSFFGLSRLLRKKKYHSVISTLTSANVILAITAKICLSKTRIVLREANTTEQELEFGNLKLKTLNSIAKYTYSLADEVVAVSSNVYSSLLEEYRLPKEKLNLIYNPVDFEYVKKKAIAKTDLASLINTQDKLVVAVGRLSEQKNFEVIIDAMPELLSRDSSYKLVILGEGHLREKLELQIARLKLVENVFLLGYKENVFPYLSRADFFVLSSLYEGLPSVLIQAMIFDCNIVVSDAVLSGPEIIDGENYGAYFESNNPEDLAKTIMESKRDKNSASDKTTYLKNNFSFNSVIPKYMKVLDL